MAHWRHYALKGVAVTAMALAAAVIAASAARPDASPAATSRQLSAELLIVRGDLLRLENEPALSPLNRDGLNQRVEGALGLLPWLLRKAGDAQGADRLRPWQQRSFADAANRAALIAEIDATIARFPIDRDAFLAPAPTHGSEARAIHEAYCAGCHDGAGNGAAEVSLPPRDLFLMARQDPPDAFLARLVNGVKGDATIQFANPLTDAQIGALWMFYKRNNP